MDEFDDANHYDEDPYTEVAPLTELAMEILEAHRENPSADEFIVIGQASGIVVATT
ncbi:MAG: hypothetical protein RIC55_33720 [Pirellulaceae bacterium]